MLNTINYCKFNLGFGSIGLCTHALYESLNHAAGRILYGKQVTDFPQVKRLFTDSYCRLLAMRLFSYRAVHYLRSASSEDRPYLLFNPIVKMKVTMQGERVIADVWDVIAARGFEKEPFFEVAAHEIGMLPKLEGTAHVNMALIVKFMRNYLFNPAVYPEVGVRDDPADDTFLFHQGPTQGLGEVRFHDYRETYDRFSEPNVEIFKAQIEAFREFLSMAGPSVEQARDIDYMLATGELFTLVVYGHLILEKAALEGLDRQLLNQIFDVMVRDFSIYATGLHGKPSNTAQQRELILGLIRAPLADSGQFEDVWQREVYSLVGEYRLAD